MADELIYKYPLLITNVVNPSAKKHNKLNDPLERLQLAREAIFDIAEGKAFEELVIVDGSNCDILSDLEIKKIERMNVKVEQLKFAQEAQMVCMHGKSHGEMQITDYAIKNSTFIRGAGGFFKISGRYTVKNLKDVISRTETYRSFFYRYNPSFFGENKRFVCTIFYKCSLDFYKDKIAQGIFECSDNPKGFLEAVFYRRTTGLSLQAISCFPWFSGIGGTHGKATSNKYYRVRKFLSMLGFLLLVERNEK